MLDRSSLIIHGRSEHTKKRQQIDILLKKATKGNKQAKLRLYKEFGIRLYSSDEVEKYVQRRVTQEYASNGKSVSNGPTLLNLKRQAKNQIKNGVQESQTRSSTSRINSKEKIRHLVKKV